MMLLVKKNLSLIADLINFILIMMIFILPIVLIWRYKNFGVFLGTLSSEINIILADILFAKLHGQQLDQENYELWITIWIPVLFYCIFIRLIMCLFKICNASY